MGRLLKDLTNIGSQIQEGDKILVERENKGYSANLSEILATKADSDHTHDEYLTELPENVVTYTIDESMGKSIVTDALAASNGVLVADKAMEELSLDEIDWGSAIIKGFGTLSERIVSPKVGFTFHEYFLLGENENGLPIPKFHWGENDYSRTATLAFTSDIPSTDGLASETYVDQKVADLVNGAPATLDTLDELAAALKDNKDIVTVLENSIATKQDKIDDLATIRSGAELGATALQTETYKGTVTGVKINGSTQNPSNGVVDLGTVITSHQDISGKADKSSLATVATSGSYNDLTDKPTIPAAVTESTVSGWGFTKNTGTYSKPSNGIPKSDLASDVQTSLGKADTALQASDLTFATDEDIDNLFV